jgi:hypothetical protein
MRLINRYHMPISIMAGLIFVVSIIALSGCAGGGNARLPDPSALAAPGGTDIGAMVEGRRLYLTECASCHRRIWPDERSPDEWGPILARHDGKVSVSSESFGNIVEYILRASEI